MSSDILDAIDKNSVVVISGDTGCGKHIFLCENIANCDCELMVHNCMCDY